MTQRMLSASAMLVLALTLTACGNQANKDVANSGDGPKMQGLRNNQGQRLDVTRTEERDGWVNYRWFNSRNTNAATMHNNTTMVMDERTGKAVSELKGVKSAYVLITERNGYVALTMDEGSKGKVSNVDRSVTNEVGKLVSDSVPHVRQVFVTRNADFYNRLQRYSERTKEGKPIRGFILEFNETVEKLFPNSIDPEGNRPRR